MTYEEILDEIQKLQTEVLINQRKIKFLTEQLTSGNVKHENALSVKNTLSYKLGNLLINTKKDYTGFGEILKGVVGLRVESLQRKQKKGGELNKIDKLLCNLFEVEKLQIDYKENNQFIDINGDFSKYSWVDLLINEHVSNFLSIKSLPIGEYEFKIKYKDKALSVNRKSIYIGFGLENSDEIKSSTGLGFSEKAGPFFYIGSGSSNHDNSYFEQTYRLKVSKELKNIQIKIFCAKPNVTIDALELDFYKEPIKKNILEAPKKEDKIEISKINFDKLADINVEYVLYADINVNVVDGSSVWFSSMASVLSSLGSVAIILKENPRSQQILSNIKGSNPITYIDPKSLDYKGIFNIDDSITIIKHIDSYSSNLSLIVVRGIDVAYSLHQDNQFLNRTASYVTDFYSIDDNKLLINEDKLRKLKLIAEKTEYLITQTEAIKNKIFELTNSTAKDIDFVPCLPVDSLKYFKVKNSFYTSKREIKIGYAGKITPSWGVIELLEWSKRIQEESNIKIKLFIASNKISSPVDGKKFRHYIHSFMKELNADYRSDLNREQCMEMLNEMDFVWCWRPAELENNTLELSTKLIEAAVTGARIINYPSTINTEVLSADYPFYVETYAEFKSLLNKKFFKLFNGENIAQQVFSKHTLERQVDIFSKVVLCDQTKIKEHKNILFASHDFKFIDSYISFLKAKGYSIRKETWEWGGHKNEKKLMENYKWADMIFCEWGLANATWYSKINSAKKPLFIRMHAQEVRDRARKFGNQIVWENVSKTIFVSNEIKNQAMNLWQKMPENKIIKIPNYILDSKLTYVQDKFDNLNEIRIGMLGIVPQTKRFDLAVELLKQLREQNINAKLYIKGYRPEDLEFMHAPSRKHELEYYYDIYKNIESNNLTNFVEYEGWGNDVNQWYSNKHFILSPSDNESFHYALADGIVAGCYPILWNWPSHDESYPFIKNFVSSVDEAKQLIEKVIKKKPETIVREIKRFRTSLLNLNSQKVVFEQLNSEIIL
ncbi:glycosyltransferase [Acinetobacter sp. C32I]|uniref:glycosyltransferase n=1 Tax=Acinetobacter sp. C32I TaxID=2950074 RepID=UPI00203676F8|nr:glycosyltransferase [Acinetobacter sp. C32I]USA52756.1 glycosyltransferase [Acinetobacter sp. C32I]